MTGYLMTLRNNCFLRYNVSVVSEKSLYFRHTAEIFKDEMT